MYRKEVKYMTDTQYVKDEMKKEPAHMQDEVKKADAPKDASSKTETTDAK